MRHYYVSHIFPSIVVCECIRRRQLEWVQKHALQKKVPVRAQGSCLFMLKEMEATLLSKEARNLFHTSGKSCHLPK